MPLAALFHYTPWREKVICDLFCFSFILFPEISNAPPRHLGTFGKEAERRGQLHLRLLNKCISVWGSLSWLVGALSSGMRRWDNQVQEARGSLLQGAITCSETRSREREGRVEERWPTQHNIYPPINPNPNHGTCQYKASGSLGMVVDFKIVSLSV